MKNEMFNKYGAVNHESEKGQALERASNAITDAVHNFCKENYLSPIEVRQAMSYLITAIDCTCCEELLTRAINMRNAEREAEKSK